MRTLISFLFAFTLSVALPLSAQTCKDVLPPAPSSQAQYWQAEFAKAYREHRPRTQLYTLLKFSLEHPQSFTSHEIAVMQAVTHNLELLATEKKLSRLFVPTHVSKALHLFGLTHLFSKKVFGIERPDSSRHLTAKALASDAFFFGGPWFLRWMHLYLSDNLAHSPELGEILKKAVAKLNESSPTVNKRIARSLAQRAHKIPATPSRTWRLGRALIPSTAFLMFAVNVYGLMPRQVAEFLIQDQLPYEYQPYIDDQYFRDLEREVKTDRLGKLLIAYSSSLDPSLDNREAPPLALSNIKAFSEGADQVVLQKIKTMQDLSEQDLGSFDTVLIFAHGNSDKLSIGLDATNLPKLKSDANLIFFSCLVAQKGGVNERWITFSKALLNGGKAVAATQVVWTYLPIPGNPSMSAAEERDYWYAKFNSALREGVGLNQFMEIYQLMDKVLISDYGLKPKGLRVYDSQTDQVRYVPSIDPLTED